MQEAVTRDYEEKQQRWREAEEAKTAKNRAKRQKKKERARQGGGGGNSKANDTAEQGAGTNPEMPLKKRRLVNGAEMVFSRPGEDGEDDDDEGPGPQLAEQEADSRTVEEPAPAPVASEAKLTIIEDD